MKKLRVFAVMTGAMALTVAAVGCKKDDQVIVAATAEPDKPGAAPIEGALPAGHPPTEAEPQAMPPGHPPINNMVPVPVPGAATATDGLGFVAPSEWAEKPARSMLWKVYGVPKAEGDAEDGELTISSLAANIPLTANVERWCGQFDLEGGKACKDAAQIKELPGATFPSKVIELAGALKAASMNGPAAAPKAGWRMVVVEVTMPGKAWYLKMTGPAKTVAKWQDAYLKGAAAIK
jgi:hypothetical protein